MPGRTQQPRAAEPPATEAVRAEWLRRVEAEYRSAAVTQQLTLWLIQIGASPDLLRDGLRIVDDELAHAELSHAVYGEAGGTGGPSIDRDSLALARHADELLELDVCRTAVQVFCLGETVAVPLFSHLRDRCTQPSARRALDRILRDEVRHRDFGWDLLDWLLETPHEAAFRRLIDGELPGMFAGLEAGYGAGPIPGAPQDAPAPADAPTLADPGADSRRSDADAGTEENNDRPDSERTWGLAPAADYAAILARTFERDFLPRFAQRGIDAAPAWRARLAPSDPGAALAAGAGDRP